MDCSTDFTGSVGVEVLNWNGFVAGGGTVFGVAAGGGAGVLLTLVKEANGFAFGVSAGGAATFGAVGVEAAKTGAFAGAVAGACADVDAVCFSGVLKMSLKSDAVWL